MIKRHDSPTDVICDVCGKTFTTSGSVADGMKKRGWIHGLQIEAFLSEDWLNGVFRIWADLCAECSQQPLAEIYQRLADKEIARQLGKEAS